MRVVTVTPAGRRRYLEALVPHLLRHRHVIDEHRWWLNTTDERDARHVEAVAARNPEFFRVVRKAVDPNLTLAENIWGFFRGHCEPDTVYVRLDDDVVWMADDAIERLVAFRRAHRDPLLVVGNIVNNAVCTHFHQRAGLVPAEWGAVGNDCLDRNGWARAKFARRLHERFLDDLRHGRERRWAEVPLPIDGTRRFSINAISWIGDDFRRVPEVQEDRVEEEPFLTETLPARLGRPNVACPEALFVHFAFWTQREYLERTWPELIGHYRAIAEGRALRPARTEPALRRIRDGAWWLRRKIRKIRGRPCVEGGMAS